MSDTKVTIDGIVNHLLRRVEALEEKVELLTKKKRTTFKAPTVIEIGVYCTKRRNSVDPVEFFNHYEANGWFRGKAKVKNWQACVRTWERDGNGRKNENLGPQNNIPLSELFKKDKPGN